MLQARPGRRKGAALLMVTGVFLVFLMHMCLVTLNLGVLTHGHVSLVMKQRQAFAAARAGLRRATFLLKAVPAGVDLETDTFQPPAPFADGSTFTIRMEVSGADTVNVWATGSCRGVDSIVYGLFQHDAADPPNVYRPVFWDRLPGS